MISRMAARMFSNAKDPVRVAVTGGTGQIAYNLLFRIASGSLFGPSQKVILQIYDLPVMQQALKGVVMELQDAAFPLLSDIVASDCVNTAFKDADYCFMVGSKPRGPGMQRSDLLKQNGEIFVGQGEAINQNAKKTVKVLVIGNPANTNCLILQNNAPDIAKENFSAMTRLDHNRAFYQVAQYLKVHHNQLKQIAIWGNHSPTMYPDITHVLCDGKPVRASIDDDWVNTNFIPTVQQRGAAIIQARKASSAASAASAGVDQMRDWALGSEGNWVSMAVNSDLYKGAYGIPSGLIFSYPFITEGGSFNFLDNLQLDEFSKEKMKITIDELMQERTAVEDMLKKQDNQKWGKQKY